MEARFEARQVNATKGLGALLLGAAFAFGWTPCIGPILGSILAVAGTQSNLWQGISLLLAYSLGLAIPFLLAALATDAFLRWSQGFKKYFNIIEKASGLLLIAVGCLIFFGSFSIVSSWLIEWFPALADIESAFSRPSL